MLNLEDLEIELDRYGVKLDHLNIDYDYYGDWKVSNPFREEETCYGYSKADALDTFLDEYYRQYELIEDPELIDELKDNNLDLSDFDHGRNEGGEYMFQLKDNEDVRGYGATPDIALDDLLEDNYR